LFEKRAGFVGMRGKKAQDYFPFWSEKQLTELSFPSPSTTLRRNKLDRLSAVGLSRQRIFTFSGGIE
jgi:hypothetical protein